jgi:hypothetical protein
MAEEARGTSLVGILTGASSPSESEAEGERERMGGAKRSEGVGERERERGRLRAGEPAGRGEFEEGDGERRLADWRYGEGKRW